jgi:hypothetical protein
MENKMKFDIKNRWTGSVQFTAEINCGEDASISFKVGLSVRWVCKNGAVLGNAVLRNADLSGAYLRNADLSGADLGNADLSGADLSGAYLRNAVLGNAVLRNADLSGADLSGADLSGAPKIENIHQAVYNAASAVGALNMNVWHGDCGTSHCRAGWVVTLAGAEGKALEDSIGTSAAAAAIYLASDPNIGKFPDFYSDNNTALADMKARAEVEAANAEDGS